MVDFVCCMQRFRRTVCVAAAPEDGTVDRAQRTSLFIFTKSGGPADFCSCRAVLEIRCRSVSGVALRQSQLSVVLRETFPHRRVVSGGKGGGGCAGKGTNTRRGGQAPT